MKNEKRKCNLPGCDRDIPENRKKTARYCCKEHAYVAKKARSIARYRDIKQYEDKFKANDAKLARLHLLTQLNKTVTYYDLDSIGFDWALVHKEVAAKDGAIWRIMIHYGYHINEKTKNVRIWKLN